MLAAGDARGAIETVLGALSDTLTDQTQKIGGGLSEQVNPDQLALMLAQVPVEERAPAEDELPGTSEPPVEGTERSVEQTTPTGPRKVTPHGRRKLPESLPREVQVSVVPPAERCCEHCGEERHVIGYEVSETLELVPAHFKVIEHRREKLACPCCRRGICVAGPAPGFKVADRCLAGPGLLTHVSVSKFFYHVPLNRTSGLYWRLGVRIGTNTLCDWIDLVAYELRPIVELMWELRLSAHLVQTDATGLKVLDREEPNGTRLGTMWGYIFDQRIAVFRYTRTGEGETGPWLHLAGRRGYLLADAANVFDRLYNGLVANAIEVGCNAHCRRRFFKLLDVEPAAAVAIDFYRKLYHIESEAKKQGLDEQALLHLRRTQSAPILASFKRWLESMKNKRPPKSAFAGACRYALNHWTALTRCLEDARLPLDNNLMELQLRSLVVGRKNWLFAGNDKGAERAAVLLSIMRTCALNGVDPMTYVRDVLVKLADGWPASRLAELLPDRWAAAQKPEQKTKSDAA